MTTTVRIRHILCLKNVITLSEMYKQLLSATCFEIMTGTFDDSFVFQVGRMSDLCQPVHERYKLAITKVMGKNLHALVVKNKKTSLEVINHLKMFHVPPEVILPLDTIKVYPIQEKLRFVNGKLDIFPALLIVVLYTVFFCVGGV